MAMPTGSRMLTDDPFVVPWTVNPQDIVVTVEQVKPLWLIVTRESVNTVVIIDTLESFLFVCVPDVSDASWSVDVWMFADKLHPAITTFSLSPAEREVIRFAAEVFRSGNSPFISVHVFAPKVLQSVLFAPNGLMNIGTPPAGEVVLNEILDVAYRKEKTVPFPPVDKEVQ
jgi:hypothetical protein